MDEEVHGFVVDALPPLNTRVRSTMPFIPNGSDAKAWEGAAFSEKKHKHHHKHHKKPDVAERGMDEEVHGFVVDALPPLNTRVRSTMPFIPNGSDAKAWEGAALSERKHHKRPDVAERGMDEEVHGFVVDALPPLNTRVRSTMPFIPNGSDAKAWEGAAFSEKKHKHHHKHHKRPDVAERGMDEEVHGFVVDALPPLNTRVRSTMPFIPNGSDAKAWEGAALSERRPDVAERGMDEEVHGFVVDALPPLNTRVRSTMPFIPNGSDAKAWEGAAFSEHKHKHHHKHHKRPDVAERGMDEEVHGFVVDALPPLNTRVRSTMPFIPNGSDAKAWEGAAFSEHKHKHHHKHHKRPDVAERGMDEEVHGFVVDALPPLNTRVRSTMPFIPNGSDAKAFEGAALAEDDSQVPVSNQWGQSFAQNQDIAERGSDLTWVHPFSSG